MNWIPVSDTPLIMTLQESVLLNLESGLISVSFVQNLLDKCTPSNDLRTRNQIAYIMFYF